MEQSIIPGKHYYKDMSDSIFKSELRSGIYYRDDPPLITTPLKIQITKLLKQSTVETSISSINPILQQFSSPNKKSIRVSTQV
ncbi:hypothetical protein CEXT_332611 [Caerostris extrusa]|uniref:Uncharacterized protein n=1 Tax=Caerostris extrusa TaxID=172846 RepID=A0AAV4SYS2_CAEEX|nr:hypothetical protein CEXT_332611 [Caerostris extrusa]